VCAAVCVFVWFYLLTIATDGVLVLMLLCFVRFWLLLLICDRGGLFMVVCGDLE
jgi:hypothetical protein